MNANVSRRELGLSAGALCATALAGPAYVRHRTDNLVERGVDFDALGFSCYQQAAEGDWQRTFTQFTRRYPDKGLFAIEYSSRKRYLNDLVQARPHGWGSYIWGPTRHQEAIFLRNGVSAGEGPRPDLLPQGITVPRRRAPSRRCRGPNAGIMAGVTTPTRASSASIRRWPETMGSANDPRTAIDTRRR
jgi:hypothetical protein